MKKILLLICLFLSSIVFSQTKEFTISGNIKSADNKELLESVTVHAERVKDSSIVSYTITDAKGNFDLVGETSDSKVKLVVSFIGFKPYTKTIVVRNQNLGTLSLKSANSLDAIIIKSI